MNSKECCFAKHNPDLCRTAAEQREPLLPCLAVATCKQKVHFTCSAGAAVANKKNRINTGQYEVITSQYANEANSVCISHLAKQQELKMEVCFGCNANPSKPDSRCDGCAFPHHAACLVDQVTTHTPTPGHITLTLVQTHNSNTQVVFDYGHTHTHIRRLMV